MILENYYRVKENRVLVSREQASAFAKQIANDFNPIHDVDSKRFCVPGDLLFSLVLNHFGLSQHMKFVFSGMVNDNIELIFPDSDASEITISGDNGKEYLHLERRGEITRDPSVIEKLIRIYVAFSGQAFPHILVPLMEEQGVMINPDRPLIIYESMEIHLDTLALQSPSLKPADRELDVRGKRGKVALSFTFEDQGRTVGHGIKKMVLSGLRPYDAQRMQEVVAD
jgi:hypothetical protein